MILTITRVILAITRVILTITRVILAVTRVVSHVWYHTCDTINISSTRVILTITRVILAKVTFDENTTISQQSRWLFHINVTKPAVGRVPVDANKRRDPRQVLSLCASGVEYTPRWVGTSGLHGTQRQALGATWNFVHNDAVLSMGEGGLESTLF